MTGTMVLRPRLNVRSNRVNGVRNVAIGISGTILDAIGGEQQTAYFGTVPAGTADTRMIFVAPSDAYVFDVLLVNTSAITQSDASYNTFTVHARLESGLGSAAVVSATTRVTGGINITVYKPTRLQGTA